MSTMKMTTKTTKKRKMMVEAPSCIQNVAFPAAAKGVVMALRLMLRVMLKGKVAGWAVMVITSPVTRVIVSRACNEDHS